MATIPGFLRRDERSRPAARPDSLLQILGALGPGVPTGGRPAAGGRAATSRPEATPVALALPVVRAGRTGVRGPHPLPVPGPES